MKLENLIKQKETYLSLTEKKICTYFIQNKHEIINLTLNDISSNTYSSNSTVWRTIEKLGFKTFSEFKFSIDWDESSLQDTQGSELLSIFLHKVTTRLNKQDFSEFYTLLKTSKKIFILYTGYSQKVQAEYFQYCLMKKGKESFILLNEPFSDLTNLIMENLTKEDLLICFSGSGENDQLKKWCAVPQMKETPIVGFTNIDGNWLTDIARVSFSPVQLKESTKVFSSLIFLVIDFLMSDFQ
ncbi:MurR/RpiR family transcriptional regulator [Enterococcus sp. UD-01]|jgi:RpiR family glv operon transcriptional regulator|uniref:MurR/RpiR family transcriptional regulator n=1 Tax=Enterococcus sp. UD-01 TaxID=3373911 RepID=UPI00383884C0